jgi:hypothetical protein
MRPDGRVHRPPRRQHHVPPKCTPSISSFTSLSPPSSRTVLRRWNPSQSRPPRRDRTVCLPPLIAIGLPRGERKPAGIGQFRAKTNGTESSNPLPSATESAMLRFARRASRMFQRTSWLNKSTLTLILVLGSPANFFCSDGAIGYSGQPGLARGLGAWTARLIDGRAQR